MKVAVSSKIRNGYLWEAVKKLGNQSALARYLNVQPIKISRWLNFKDAPNLSVEKYTEKLLEIELKLFDLTGHWLEEIFPPEIRTDSFLKQEKHREIFLEMPVEQLVLMGAVPMRQTNFLESSVKNERREQISTALSTLTPREEKVIRLRFGFDGEKSYELEEIGEIIGVTRERVRQIEAHSIRKLRHPPRSRILKGLLKKEKSMGYGDKSKITIPLDECFDNGKKVIETEKSYGVILNGQKIYLPKSQMDDEEITDEQFSCWLAKWLIKENGLDMFLDTSDEPYLFSNEMLNRKV